MNLYFMILTAELTIPPAPTPLTLPIVKRLFDLMIFVISNFDRLTTHARITSCFSRSTFLFIDICKMM